MTADLPGVLALPAPLLRRLPEPCTLVCRAQDIHGRLQGFWVTTSYDHYQRAAQAAYAAVNGHEWLALVIAAEAGAAQLALAQWLVPGYPLGLPPPWAIRGTLYDLTGGRFRAVDRAALWDGVRMRSTVGDVLAHFGAELLAYDPPLNTKLVQEGLL